MISQPSRPFLEVSNLSFRFEAGQDPVLKNITFEINENENILVLGPSGSGKSTLAYCLNNLYPSSVDGIMNGYINYKGRALSSFEPGEANRKIGFVMQDPDSQFCMLTAEEEVAFVLENIRFPRLEMEERIHYVLDLVDLLPFKHRLIHTLSGGQKQKLAIACALAMEPELLILDEPTANLDPASGFELVQTLKKLKKSHSFSILVIEHNLDNWLDFVDRCIIFNSKGELFLNGPPNICFAEYARELASEGIWLPRTIHVGLRLQDAGLLKSSSLPMTISEIIEHSEDIGQTIEFLSTDSRKQMHTPSPSIISAKGVSYSRDNHEIIQEISLSIHAGEFIAIAGANGSGKTTFSKCLAGLIPSRGEIRLYGLSLGEWHDEKKWRRLGYVFQNPEHQFITDSVIEEINYSLQAKEQGPQKYKNTEILKKLRMADQLYNHPFSLSQGQKRRLSVAVMLVNGQEVLIMDEPTFGQDAVTSKEIIDFAVKAVPETGSIIMITHDMDIIDRYADKVLVLEKGNMLFYESPGNLWDQPGILARANLRVPFLREMAMHVEGRYAVK
ncbi:energy-coupling factor transporter ATPase [Mesobacillus subterraneus]|uniref:ABC transporter ATP-binding protein n=1 Tax=Mesobacillus subterraneus TaxID=285983 RepID=UPI00273E3A06|nr:ABC transporter ATP-binding protein [Mesobacillus subterraneus]WLR56845.1 energy-coupling factor transporter ATPase [Mesobacillus subterraneus]